MLSWAIAFLILALIAGLLGFTGIAGTAANIAVILFWIFIALFLLGLIINLVRGKPAGTPPV